MEFYELLERLITELNAVDSNDFSSIQDTLTKICELLRLAKIHSVSYQNAKAEAAGIGHEMIGYDNGKECELVSSRRFVTPLMSVINCCIYIEKGQKPWTEQELSRIKMVIQVLTVYISRMKVITAAETYVFLDDSGYKNLRAFIRRLDTLNTQKRLAGMAAVHYNLKHFSLVNQQLGRKAGDTIMKSYYEDVSSSIKGRGIVCRFGGDNFALLCDYWELDSVLTKLSGQAVTYDPKSGDRVLITASVGVYMIPDDFVLTDPGDIIDKIITASTAARTKGKEDIVFFSDAMLAVKDHMMRIQQLFPTAIEKEEFKVYYQPKVNVNTGEMIGAEALCRWSRNGNIIPPAEFIPVLEQSMDICKLDLYMLDHVCRDIRRWLNEGRQVVRVSVNLSRKHMMDVDLLEHIIDIIDANKCPHNYIEIELTETNTDVEFRELKRLVNALQREGIRTSVDDFGMGYSSLNLIKEIPWNTLKIDKVFLPGDSESPDGITSVMFRHVASLARELGMECIAEGVETQAQVQILRDNGCELAQGYFFDKPLPVDEYEKRLDSPVYTIK